MQRKGEGGRKEIISVKKRNRREKRNNKCKKKKVRAKKKIKVQKRKTCIL